MESKRKILVVDDDINMLELLIDTLDAIGYQAVGVDNGQDALRKLKKENFDLVISDIRMPRMDGIELLKKIRQDYDDMPVLFITAVDSSDMIASATPDGILSKPFRISHIEKLIKSTLDGLSE